MLQKEPSQLHRRVMEDRPQVIGVHHCPPTNQGHYCIPGALLLDHASTEQRHAVLRPQPVSMDTFTETAESHIQVDGWLVLHERIEVQGVL